MVHHQLHVKKQFLLLVVRLTRIAHDEYVQNECVRMLVFH